jgi:hypothetical protein
MPSPPGRASGRIVISFGEPPKVTKPLIDTDWIETALEESRQLFLATQNPVFVFRGIAFARRYGRQAEWALSEIHEMSRRLLRGGIGDGIHDTDKWYERVIIALGFPHTGGGPIDPFKQARREYLAMEVAVRVRILVDGDQLTPNKASLCVAADAGVSKSTAKRYWERYGAFARRSLIEDQREAIAGKPFGTLFE